MALTVYKSSAGSGKTYTLAKEYLKLALKAPDYYQKILAVTFTNRAAEEMKERVLDFLIGISRGRHELIDVFSDELEKSEDQIIHSAKACLSHLLHHYSLFNITTIDTFFHRIIRSFSREIGLQGSFGIELDTDKVADFITSSIYEGVEHDHDLKNWLVDFSMNGLAESKGYETKSQVSKLAKQLFEEEFKRLPQNQFASKEARRKIKKLKSTLFKTKNLYENELIAISRAFDEAMLKAGLSIDELVYKASGPAGFFLKLSKKEFDNLITKRVAAALEDPRAWTSKSGMKKDLIVHQAEVVFIPLMHKALKFMEDNDEEYYTATASLNHLFTLGLISDLSQRLIQYKKEEETIMISDLPDFLSQIIDDSSTPFIYEKVGSWYDHFLIDEFQDTSQFQWNNFKPLLEESLANGNENIIVGDAKQSIYGWRGGDSTLLLNQVYADIPQTQFDDSKNINWRSAPNIIAFNNQLFSALPQILVDELGELISTSEAEMILKTYAGVSQKVADIHKEEQGLVQLEFLEANQREWKELAMNKTIESIETLLEEGHQLNDMAILVRTNKEATEIVNHVLEHRREHQSKVEVISAEGMLLQNANVVQLLLSAFHHLIQPDDISLKVDLTYRYQKHVKTGTFELHEDFASLANGGLPDSFTKYKQYLLHLPILELVEVLIRVFELDQLKDEFAYLQAFQDAVLEYSKSNRSDLRMFMEWWDDVGAQRSVQLTGALNAVEVITSHKSKGLQYPIVFVPFCNYSMDSRAKPVWYPSPFEENEMLPVDYKSELEKTRFVHDYQKDVVKWHLESLNILYVAFTRAERGLYVFSEKPSNTDKAYSTSNKLLWAFFEHYPIDGWDETSKVYKNGKLEVKIRKNKDKVVCLHQYASYKWSNKLQIRKMSRAFDPQREDLREEGVLLHQILSEIIHYKDTEELLNRYECNMKITKADRKRFQTIFQNLWKDDLVKSWFNGEGDVKTEVVVLPKDGETKRMDRVVIDGTRATVIDFKSGQQKTKDTKQLKEYATLLSDMGYIVDGYLLYLMSGEVKKV